MLFWRGYCQFVIQKLSYQNYVKPGLQLHRQFSFFRGSFLELCSGKYRSNHFHSNSSRKYVRGNISEFQRFSTDSKNMQRPQSTVDEEEINKFAKLAQFWWDEGGEFEPLHSLNELRVPFIRNGLLHQRLLQADTQHRTSRPLDGLLILDVGSGGGILSEPLARLGAFVIGVDASEENIKIAHAHASFDPRIASSVKYIRATVEDLLSTEEKKFDAVIASEVIEHVSDMPSFVGACCQLVKPGGSIFFTTLNKTVLSCALGVYGAENILRIVPQGSHDWNKFVAPEDLEYILDQHQFSTRLIHGMLYNPLTKRWSWIKNTSINYALHAIKTTEMQPDYLRKSDDSEKR